MSLCLVRCSWVGSLRFFWVDLRAIIGGLSEQKLMLFFGCFCGEMLIFDDNFVAFGFLLSFADG